MGAEAIHADLIERWAQYIPSSRIESLREACSKASIENANEALRPFFATWTTSLMGSDLEKLRSISADCHIRTLIETIVIQDQCRDVDPWAVPELPALESRYCLWPRDNKGIVVASRIGIADLSHMLRDRLLCPKTIRVVDYQITPPNFFLGPEMARVRHLIGDVTPTAAEPGPLATLVKVVLESANMDVRSLAFGYVDTGTGENSVLSSARFRERYPGGISIGSPSVREAVIEVSTSSQGEKTRFSNLYSADLKLGRDETSYWLEQVFYTATKLKYLKLSVQDLQNLTLQAEMVVPILTDFFLHATTISADNLRAMMAPSRQSLTHVCFRQVVLKRGSSWGELLLSIAKEYQALKSFELCILREAKSGGPAVDFREAKGDPVLEQYEAGLRLREKGPDGNKRVTQLSYKGADAGKVLQILSAHGYAPDSYEASRSRGEHSQEVQAVDGS